jgi:hypothetical protein
MPRTKMKIFLGKARSDRARFLMSFLRRMDAYWLGGVGFFSVVLSIIPSLGPTGLADPQS